MGLSTKDVKTTGGSNLSKNINPGQVKAFIRGISLKESKFPNKDTGGTDYFIELELETEPIEGFVGFMVDKNDESKGHYLGQTARVEVGRFNLKRKRVFAFGDSDKLKLNRDQLILRQLAVFGEAMGIREKIDALDADDIEAFVEAANEVYKAENKSIWFTLGGREYKNKGGYINHFLFLAGDTTDGKAVAATEAELVPFSKEDHIDPIKEKPKTEMADFDVPDIDAIEDMSQDPVSDPVNDLPFE